MPRRMDETDLKNLRDSAYGGFAHPVDITRLVEEVEFYRQMFSSIPSLTLLKGDDDREGRRAVMMEVLQLGLSLISPNAHLTPPLETDPFVVNNLGAMRRDPQVHGSTLQYEMYGGSLVETLAAFVAAQWSSKWQYLSMYLEQQQANTTPRSEQVFPQVAGYTKSLELLEDHRVRVVYEELPADQPVLVTVPLDEVKPFGDE